MQNKNHSCSLLLMLLITVFVIKDFLMPQIFYVLNNENQLYYSLLDAFLQFILLIFAMGIFYAVQYAGHKKNRILDSAYSTVSFWRKHGYTPISIKNFVFLFVISVVSFLSFQLAKNVYVFIQYSFSYNEALIAQLVPYSGLPLFVIFMIHVIWAGTAEEMVYRGGIFGVLLHQNKKAAYFISVLPFAFAHRTIEQFIQSAFLGIILCIVFRKTFSVFACILVHILYNTLGMLSTYYYIPPYALDSSYGFGYTRYDYWLMAFRLLIYALFLLILNIYLINQLKIHQDKQEVFENNRFNRSEKVLLMIFMTFFAVKVLFNFFI